jgi:hypothetical protein
VKRSASDPRIECGSHERRQLAGLSYDGSKHGGDICRAVGAQPNQSSRRKERVGRVNDGATGDKRNPMGGSDSGCNVRLRVDRCCACLRVKQSLVRRISDRGIEADDSGMHRPR